MNALHAVIHEGQRSTSTRASALAERLEQGAQALAIFVENLSDDEWETVVPVENRSVGVLVHHVALVYPAEIDVARQAATGQAITWLTRDFVDHMNAQHALDHPVVSKPATLDLLRENSRTAAERIREFTDEELDHAAPISLYGNAPLTAQFLIEDHALRHSFQHLANIRTALNR